MKAIFSFSLLLLALPLQADPTRPPATVQAQQQGAQSMAAPGPRLELIIETANGYQAMLNGNLVKAGDRFGHYRVQSITAERVVLVGDSGQLQLSINNKKIKTYEP
ncbi:MAG: hypothetical protein ACK4GU_05955 [Alishewanella aestuarii]|jgi:hypothetical protein|uniref:MSHA biogenesis protein MshK n=1 Tax=Alishewanella aestuarii B11 TaxID=1197174 RepID=J1QJF5_9ALTE|nr:MULTISPECIES: hypothetical protein [Alishewanella]EJI85696.1 hypothetical protein AEST_14340 [Alishewanella aestuarii B11]MCT8126362.1 hypothetical protein [Alishewanella sp. BS5-314]